MAYGNVQLKNLDETANSLFEREAARATWNQIVARITRHCTCLAQLNAEDCTRGLHGEHYGGLTEVPLELVCGTESRGQDFDAEFRPTRSHNRERWLSVALARLQGRGLPPVTLILKDGLYYVRDGHHRVSVARALGEAFIEAEVIVWENA